MFGILKNKRVLVTGASSGIGAATAKLLGAHGAKVGVHYKKNQKGAGETANVIRKTGEAEIFFGDLFDPETRESLIRNFVEKFGGIDVLVNNAGGCDEYTHFLNLTDEIWNKMVLLHIIAPFTLSQKAFPHMQKQKWGRIVNITTNAANYAGPNSMHYYASKAALDAVTQGFAREGAKDNVLVTSIRCGLIDTPMHTKVSGYSNDEFKKRVSLVPLGKAGTPMDVARAVLFLVSEGGNFITGEILKVAGGE